MRPTFRSISVPALLLVLAAPAAPGQETGEPKAIEPGVGDVDPLGTSLRELRLDLRQPSNFDQVFKAPGDGDRLMRVNGGLYAVFPRSQYIRSRFGPLPEIPSGTIFYIGGLAPAAPGLQVPMTPFEPRAPVPAPTSPDEGPSLAAIRPAGDPHAKGDTLPRPVLPVFDEWIPVRVGDEPDAPPVHATLLEHERLRTIANDPEYRPRRLHAILRRVAASVARDDAARAPRRRDP